MDIDSSWSVYAIGSGDSTRILRFFKNGEFMWARAFQKDYNINDESRKMIIIGRDNKILSAFAVLDSGHNDDIYVLKMNSSGSTVWKRTYAFDSTSYETTSALVDDNRGNVYVSGYSLSIIGGINFLDTYVILQDTSTGDMIRTIRKAGINNYLQYTIAGMDIDKDRNIIITGYAHNGNFYDDGITMKFAQPVRITQTNNKIPSNYKLNQNYPNPFNPTTIIRFDIKKSTHTKLIIYDILGKEVAILVNDKLSAGSYEVSWDAANYPSGVYFYRLAADEYVDTK